MSCPLSVAYSIKINIGIVGESGHLLLSLTFAHCPYPLDLADAAPG